MPNHLINCEISLTASLEYKGKTLQQGCIIIKFSELGEEFSLIHQIIIINEKDFFVAVKSITDCFPNETIKTYKIYSTNFFHWEVLNKNDLDNAEISYVNKLKDGFCYILRTWL